MGGLTCNIDRKGRVYRATMGALLLILALLLLIITNPNNTLLPVLEGLLTLGGLFCLFQAAMGWCALRAMGFKTKI